MRTLLEYIKEKLVINKDYTLPSCNKANEEFYDKFYKAIEYLDNSEEFIRIFDIKILFKRYDPKFKEEIRKIFNDADNIRYVQCGYKPGYKQTVYINMLDYISKNKKGMTFEYNSNNGYDMVYVVRTSEHIICIAGNVDLSPKTGLEHGNIIVADL